MATVTIRRTVEGREEVTALDRSDALQSLKTRGLLPGAFGYDRAAHLFRTLQAEGSDPVDLLPAAYPSSWLVNSRATSRVFVQWATMDPTWASLFEVLRFDRSQEEWLALDATTRARALRDVTTLATIPGATLVSVTKVLALLVPQLVPLMDDAAIHWALGAIAKPATADDPKAGPDLFLPMMDWFARESLDAEEALVDLAREHTLAVLDAPQILDRLLWFESWGRGQLSR